MKELTFFSINITEEPTSIQAVLPSSILELRDSSVRAAGEVVVDLKVHREREGHFLVTGSLKAQPEVCCGRCRRWFPLSIVIDDYLLLLPQPHPQAIDLTPYLREDIILQLPMIADCSLEAGGELNAEKKCEIPASNSSSSLRRGEVWSALDQLKLEE